jgi:hypothetical protein
MGSVFRLSDYSFGVVQKSGHASFAFRHGSVPMGSTGFIDQGMRHFDGKKWVNDKGVGRVFKENQADKYPLVHRFIDLDGSGACVMIDTKGKVYRHVAGKDWQPAPFTLPLASESLMSGAVRFLDIDGDGKIDLIHSSEKEFGVYQFGDMKTGWKKLRFGKPGDPGAFPAIARGGTNNGSWAHSGQLWWANEDTHLLKNNVDRRAFKELLESK